MRGFGRRIFTWIRKEPPAVAEIPIEKKSSKTWIWILLALLLLGLLLWWLLDDDETAEVAVAPTAIEQPVVDPMVAPAAPAAEGAGTAGAMTLAAITQNPGQYFGQSFSGEVDVPEVPTDRGFWVTQDGARLFALIVDEPREVPLDINSGQRLRITNGELRSASQLEGIPGAAIDADTRRILGEQQIFMIADEADIEILSRS